MSADEVHFNTNTALSWHNHFSHFFIPRKPFATIKNNPGTKNSQPSFDRLIALKEILENKNVKL